MSVNRWEGSVWEARVNSPVIPGHVPAGRSPVGTCPGMTGEFTPNTSLPSIHTHSQFSDYFLIFLDFHPSRTILLPSRSGQEGASRSSRGGAGCDGPVAIVRPFARKAISEECAPRSCRETSGSRRRAAQGPSKRGGPRFSQSPLRCGLLGVASRKIVACGTQAYCCIRGLLLPCAVQGARPPCARTWRRGRGETPGRSARPLGEYSPSICLHSVPSFVR